MGRKRTLNTPNNIDKLIKEGRGQGEGPLYKPWLNARAKTNKSYTDRTKGWKTGRVHHFLSNLEFNYFLTLEWSPYVIDIREQYPLLPIERTIKIAESLGIDHPYLDGEYKVMTTDFLITLQTPEGIKQVVRTIKSENDLDTRQIDKFEIERVFFLEQGITDWCIVTDRNVNLNIVKNIEWLHDAKDLDLRNDLEQNSVDRIAKLLLQEINKRERGLAKITSEFDEKLGLEPGTSLFVVRHLLANKNWLTDITSEKINPSGILICKESVSQKGSDFIATNF